MVRLSRGVLDGWMEIFNWFEGLGENGSLYNWEIWLAGLEAVWSFRLELV